VQAASSIEGQPATDGVAMHPKEGCHLLAVAGLATGQPVEHLQARFLLPVLLSLEHMFERLARFSTGWHRETHELPSQ
jgi:hypothetical protein